MSQLPVTIVGNLAADPVLKKLPNGVAKAELRVASSRRWSKTDEEGHVEWNETDLLFLDVEVWDKMAGHVKLSLCKGMPVIVVGSVNSQLYVDKAGMKRSKTFLRATSIGLDLGRYIIACRRMDGNNAPKGMALPDTNVPPFDQDYTDENAAAEPQEEKKSAPPEPVVRKVPALVGAPAV